MFIRLLNDADKELFAKVAYLLSLADNPLLWNGKTREEVSANDDFSRLGIQKDEAEMALLKEWGIDVEEYQQRQVYNALLEKLKDAPLSRVEDEATRITHACFVLEELLGEGSKKGGVIPEIVVTALRTWPAPPARTAAAWPAPSVRTTHTTHQTDSQKRGFASPAIPKVMLYHLMLMALSDGYMTPVEEALLQLFSAHAQIPDFIYEEIQERAEAAHTEIQKTLAIILE